MMAGIRAANTKPELIIRRGLHAKGFRFRLHNRELPGKPDLVLPRYRAIIFVHGCFWHRHECTIFKWPKTRQDFWRNKIQGNFERDKKVEAALKAMGWRILRIWECSLRGPQRVGTEQVIDQVVSWLRSRDSEGEISGSEC
jgi:DNA mismatch endonuclease (patch repair protein)